MSPRSCRLQTLQDGSQVGTAAHRRHLPGLLPPASSHCQPPAPTCFLAGLGHSVRHKHLGGGAILKFKDVVREHWHCSWQTKFVARLGVQAGKTKHQTFWESLTVLMSMMLWGSQVGEAAVLIIGDNTAALQN